MLHINTKWPELPTATLSWHASTHMVDKLHIPLLFVVVFMCDVFWALIISPLCCTKHASPKSFLLQTYCHHKHGSQSDDRNWNNTSKQSLAGIHISIINIRRRQMGGLTWVASTPKFPASGNMTTTISGLQKKNCRTFWFLRTVLDCLLFPLCQTTNWKKRRKKDTNK